MVSLKIDVPDSFLNEEVRCGYIVTKQMKEVWAVELDLYMELRRVCDKYGLKFAGSSGTALGAARHNGFIPWDDDLDFMMLRDDYEKLCKVAAKEFREPYYFENYWTDPHFFYGAAKLVNEATTGYENQNLKHHGIFIDIFVFDNIPDDRSLYDAQYKEALSLYKKYQRIVTCDKNYYKQKGISLPRRVVRLLYYLLFSIRHDVVGGKRHVGLYKKYDEVCMRYDSINTNYAGNIGALWKEEIVPRDAFESLVDMDFEFLKMPMIRTYEEYLTRLYGDWHKFVRGTSAHTFKIIDTNRSYKDVLKGKELL